MDFIKSSIDQYVNVLKHYTLFEGRARRSEFWKFTLVSFVIGMILKTFLGEGFANLYWLAVLIPSLGIGARRLHDIGKSGWWQLMVLIPLLGAILLIVFFVLDSEPKDNAYGPNPKGTASSTPSPEPTAPPTLPPTA